MQTPADAHRRRLLALSAWALASSAGAASPSRRAPEVLKRASDGHPLLADASPWRATYLDFWASWCGPCRLSFPWMNALHERLAGSGLRIVGVNLDRREADAQRFLRERPARFALLMDPQGELARLFDITAMPTSLLISADRGIVFTHAGFRSGEAAELERRIEVSLRGPA